MGEKELRLKAFGDKAKIIVEHTHQYLIAFVFPPQLVYPHPN